MRIAVKLMFGRLWLLGLWMVIGWAGCATQPSLTFADDTPDDLQELGTTVWEEVVAAFPNQLECLGEVTLAGDWTLEGSKAYYLPDDAQVVLGIPATAAHLRHSLVHELAHHLEHVCPSHAALRAAFLASQGLATDTPWFEGPSWEETPSEQYAEAVVRVVLERPVVNYRLDLSPEAIEVVKEWGGGG